MNKLVKSVDKADLYKEFLKSLNGVLQLTDRELELMVTLVELDVAYVKLPGCSKNVINSENRKYIRQKLGITPDNLSRYIGRFKEKGLLVQGKVEDEVTVNKAIIPELIGDRVQITVILKIKNDEKNNKAAND